MGSMGSSARGRRSDDHRWSRRELLIGGVLAGAGLAAGSAAQWSGREAVAAAPAPRYGGIWKQDLEADIPNFDMHQGVSGPEYRALAPCYNLLVQTSPVDTRTVIPDLANRWEIGPDGKVYTFHLRRGVKFHHGKPFGAADVKASWERIVWPPKGVISQRKDIYAAVDGIEAPDDYTVKFVLKRPMASLLTNIAQGVNFIFPKDVLDAKGDMKTDVIGTGPFKFKQYVRGVSFEVVKNPDYFMPGRPYLDGITYFIIPDPNTALSALLSGQIMYHQGSKPQAAQAAQTLGGKIRVRPLTSMQAYFVQMNARKKPWNDPRVRRAVSLAIDRTAAVQTLTDGAGQISGMLRPGGRWALPATELQKVSGYAPTKAPEIARARELLAQAGFPNGFKTTLLVQKGEVWESTGVFTKDQLAQVGIDATLDVKEAAALFAAEDRRDYDMLGGTYTTPVDDPDAVFGQNYLCASTRNYANECFPDVDRLFASQSQIADPARRLPAVHALERASLEDVEVVILTFRVIFHMYWNTAGGFYPDYSIYLTGRHETTWLAG